MRLTKKLEARVLATLRETPDACIAFPPEAYRDDGSITIIRDGLTYRLHRYLEWKLTGTKLDSRMYLIPGGCRTDGCMNPNHRIRTRQPASGHPRPTCPRGHPYEGNTVADKHRRCATCKEEYNARRRKGTRRAGYCKHGHKLTPGNCYLWRDVSGREHRRCKRCTLATTRARRAKPNGEQHGNSTRESDRRDREAQDRLV